METTSNTSNGTRTRGKAKHIGTLKTIYFHAIVLHLEGKAVKAIILSSNTSSSYDVKRNNILRYDKMFHPEDYLDKNKDTLSLHPKTLDEAFTTESEKGKGFPPSRKALIIDVFNHGKKAFVAKNLKDLAFVEQFSPETTDQESKKDKILSATRDHLLYACMQFKKLNPEICLYNDLDAETCCIISTTTEPKASGLNPHIKNDNSGVLSQIVDELSVKNKSLTDEVKLLKEQLEAQKIRTTR